MKKNKDFQKIEKNEAAAIKVPAVLYPLMVQFAPLIFS